MAEHETRRDCPIKVGDKFSSFAEVEYIIQKFEEHQSINYYRRDSRTIATGRKNGVKKNIKMNDRLKFHEARYTCLRGGRIRAKTKRRPFHVKCESFVQFRISKNGQFLIVNGMSCVHNHPIDKNAKVKKRIIAFDELDGVFSGSLPITDSGNNHIEASTICDKSMSFNKNNGIVPDDLQMCNAESSDMDTAYEVEEAKLKKKLLKLKRKRQKEQIRRKSNISMSLGQKETVYNRNMKLIMEKLEMIAEGQKEIFARLDQLSKCQNCMNVTNEDSNHRTEHVPEPSEFQNVNETHSSVMVLLQQ